MMRRALIIRFLTLWVAFGLGALVSGWIVSRHAAECKATIVELDNDGFINAAQGALPAAATGPGVVEFKLEFNRILVHADSMFTNQTYDASVAALVQGSPITVDVSTKLLRRMLAR